MFAACLPFIACKNIVLFTFYVCFKFSKMNWCRFWAIFENFGAWGRLRGINFHCLMFSSIFPTYLPFVACRNIALFSFYLVEYFKISKNRAQFCCTRGLGPNLGKFQKIIFIFSDFLLC